MFHHTFLCLKASRHSAHALAWSLRTCKVWQACESESSAPSAIGQLLSDWTSKHTRRRGDVFAARAAK
eukprot:2146351-Amphidinium_carterae.1